MRLDLHNHTRYSPDSTVDPADLVRASRGMGLDGLAITDHNSMAGVASAREAAAGYRGFIVVPAVEVSTADGHILAFGVDELPPRDLPTRETVERIVAAGGVAVAAHPYRFWSGLGERATISAAFSAYEARNARTLRGANEKAERLAETNRVGRTGGSDAHFLHEHGRAFTIVDGGPSSADDVVQAIGSMRTRAEGLDRGAKDTVLYVTKCVSEWIGRGMRRI